jgi:hypothetical protein
MWVKTSWGTTRLVSELLLFQISFRYIDMEKCVIV